MNLLKKIKIRSVEIQQRLKRKMDPNRYDFIALDITSNCNLRCPFCINDFSQIKGNRMMSETTFDKALSLLPLAPVAGFGISCLFEPGLHPDFIKLLEKIPGRYFERVFFTTNLSMKFSDDDFYRLCRAPIHHVNISLDSLVPATFETLRKNAKYDRFMDNLERLTAAVRNAPNPPKLRYSSIVLQSNLEEIPDLLETCAARYLASVHELRFVYKLDHLSLEWKKANLISNDQWEQLHARVAQSSHRVEIVPPPPVYFPEDRMPYSRNADEGLSATGTTGAAETLYPLGLRIGSDGGVELYGRDIGSVNINDLPDPYQFFNGKRKEFAELATPEP